MSLELAVFCYPVIGAREFWIHWSSVNLSFGVTVRVGRIEFGLTVMWNDYVP